MPTDNLEDQIRSVRSNLSAAGVRVSQESGPAAAQSPIQDLLNQPIIDPKTIWQEATAAAQKNGGWHNPNAQKAAIDILNKAYQRVMSQKEDLEYLSQNALDRPQPPAQSAPAQPGNQAQALADLFMRRRSNIIYAASDAPPSLFDMLKGGATNVSDFADKADSSAGVGQNSMDQPGLAMDEVAQHGQDNAMTALSDGVGDDASDRWLKQLTTPPPAGACLENGSRPLPAWSACKDRCPKASG